MPDKKRALIEMGGIQHWILKDKLPLMFREAERLRELAVKAGSTREQAEETFTVKIVKVEE